MKTSFVAAVGWALAMAAFQAGAAGQGSAVDAYYSNLTLSIDGIDDELRGNGGGVRLWFGQKAPFLSAEYQYSQADGRSLGSDVDAKVQNWRAGLGWRVLNTRPGALWLRGEYLAFDGEVESSGLGIADDETQEGFGVHLGGQVAAGPVRFFTEVGYLDVDDADGLEWRAGVGYQPSMVGVFAEFRRSDLEIDDTDDDLTYEDARVGVRVAF